MFRARKNYSQFFLHDFQMNVRKERENIERNSSLSDFRQIKFRS